ncbi:MAG TPA: hypothetical protein H9898_02680 [Candidatus Anaerobiospirillum stercoravium]|nr:hypothetical protein [Candidatus Anaerobiospirillum stercoravium]
MFSCASRRSLLLQVLIALVFSVVIELFVFNFSYFADLKNDLPWVEVDLPMQEHLGRRGVVLNAQNPNLNLNRPGVAFNSVLIETWSPASSLAKGSVYISDQSNQFRLVPANTFELNPGGATNSAVVKIDNHGEVYALSIRFEERTISNGVLITKIVLNPHEGMSWIWGRVLLLWTILLAILGVAHFKPYQREIDLTTPSSKKLHLVVGITVSAVSLFVFLLECPWYTNVLAFDLLGETSFILTSPEHSLLLPFPTTTEQLKTYDIYTQLLDAFLKGQFNIDLPVDPRLLSLTNLYDISAWINSTNYCWDLSLYEGKYYAYFGIAPLFLIYFPVYWLTGMVPTAALVCGVFSFLGCWAFTWALYVLGRVLRIRANLLIVFLTEVALVFSSMVFFIQISLSSYHFLYLICFLFFSLAVACSYGLLIDPERINRKRILLLVLGIAVPFIVMSRPHALLYVLMLCAVPLFGYFKALPNHLKRCQQAAFLAVPLLAGALWVMWYNYARFGSIFEFGISYQLTFVDYTSYDTGYFWEKLRNAVFHYFIEPIGLSREFPYFVLKTNQYLSNGNNLYLAGRVSLFSFPIFMLLFLIFFKHEHQDNSPAGLGLVSASNKGIIVTPTERWLKILLGITTLCVIAVSYGIYTRIGTVGRYLFDVMLPLLFFAFVIITTRVHYQRGLAGQALYCLTCYWLIKSIVMGFFLMFGEPEYQLFQGLNPEAWLYLRAMFSPLSFSA